MPEDQVEAQKIKSYSTQYVMIEGKLYRRSYPLLHYLRPAEANYTLYEIHEDIYGSYLGGPTLAYKILQPRYY